MPVTINGTTGIAGVDGSASTPAVQGSDTNTGEFFPAADTIAWTTGGSERMRVDSSGNVGVGTSSPAAKLEVVNSADAAIQVTSGNNVSRVILNNTGTGGRKWTFTAGNTAYSSGALYLEDSTAGATRLAVDSSGNVGIGTSTPIGFGGTNLNIKAPSSSAYGSILVESGSYVWEVLANQTGNVMSMGSRSNHPLTIATNDTERMRIDTSGNVGIGTSSPSSRFTVIGDIHVGTSGNSARINNSGNDIVQFFGNRNGASPYFYYNTGNSYGTTSDARSKNSITDISTSDALDYVMKLKPSSFKMNGNDKYQAGFIAQNCLEASQNDCQKSAVANYETYDEQDKDCPYLGVSDRPILAHAIAAIQELKSIIDAQAAEIAALKANAPA